MFMDYPFGLDRRGGTALADDRDHIRDLIEQVLLTSPGERVNRPGFGSGLLQLVFAPGNQDALTAAATMSARASLQQWLGSLVQVSEVVVETSDSTLTVTVCYTIRRTGETEVQQFERAV